ncbi:hypothetical protein M9458_008158, partial [Cirrhinus mrigala]
GMDPQDQQVLAMWPQPSCIQMHTEGSLHDLNEQAVNTSETELKKNSCLVAAVETILLHTAAQQLNLKGQPEDLILRTVRQDQQILHGVAVSFTVLPVSHTHKKYLIQRAFTAERLGLAKHTYPVASSQKRYRHLAGLPLQQMDRISHISSRLLNHSQNPPGMDASRSTHQCFFTSVLPNTDLFAHVERLWQMDVIPYRSDRVVTRSKLDQEAISLLQEKTVRVEVQGTMRYATPLLRMRSMPRLTMPKEAVLPQLRSNPEQASAYQTEISRLKEAGYVAKLDPREVDSSTESWYIPHHIVQHNNKNRVVYNCSFQFEGHSLNELLLPGPTLGPSLLVVLLCFRENPVAISSDIRGMFHQVRLLPGDMPLLRFLWRDLMPERPPNVYQWQVLPFGTTCSPCCAMYALQRQVMDHSQPGDQLREVIERSFYVDNCLRSLHSPQEAKELVNQLCALLATGGFELRQWASNGPSAITHLPAESRSSTCDLWLSQGQQDVHESTLGLQWHCQSDTLRYKHRAKHSSPATMHQIYRVLASQYDPLGYLIPYITRAKILVQRLWDKKHDWDDPQLPKDLLTSWHEWEKELSGLEETSLPRCYSRSQKDHPSCKYDVHVFCDASEQAYGSVAYLRIKHEEGQVEVAFITSRSRVAPRKQQSIPCLELCAALSGSQLSHLLTTELTIPINSTILWSDFTTVLMWLTSSSCRYKVFVGTRVAEIQEMTASAVWRYVRSSDNPADDITRGKSIRDLSEESRFPQIVGLSSLPLPFDEPSCKLRQSSFSGLVTTTTPLVKLQHYDMLAEYLNAYGQELHGAAYTSSADLQRDIQQAVLRQATVRYWKQMLYIQLNQKDVLDFESVQSVGSGEDAHKQRYFCPAFYSTDMDCFGPYLVKIGRRNEKSIDFDSFLMALRRFIGRRGKPYELLCDQGTNFKGGERELDDAFTTLQDELKSHLANQQIKFIYNPPSAPLFGGCWEREIRSIKAAFGVTIGAQTVTEEVLRTVLIEVEGILNSKPLGYTSSDVADLDPITPYCFLIGHRDVSLPQVIYQESEMLSRRRWRHSQLLAEHFWKHFLKHYLPDLQARQKWKTEKRTLEIGDVVLIIDPQLPRALWCSPVQMTSKGRPTRELRLRQEIDLLIDEQIQFLNSGAASRMILTNQSVQHGSVVTSGGRARSQVRETQHM